MHRHRHQRGALGQPAAGRLGQPAAEDRGEVGPVAMLQRQHEPPPGAVIAERRHAPGPWPRPDHAVVAEDAFSRPALPGIGLRRAAEAAGGAGDEARLAPAGRAEPALLGHRRVAGRALRRIDEPQRGFQTRGDRIR